MSLHIGVCPTCNEKGKSVPYKTVTRIVHPDIRSFLSEGDYFLCMDPRCHVGYFNMTGEIIDKAKFKRPIWFKKGAYPKIACYCGNITQEDVFKTVLETNLKDQEAITLFLRGQLFNTCHSTNPQGVCCTDAFQGMIDQALAMKSVMSENRRMRMDSIEIDVDALKATAGGSSCGCGCSSGEVEQSGKQSSCCGSDSDCC